MSRKLHTILCTLLIIILPCATALRCYTCTYVTTSSDTSCINNPDAVITQKFTNCAKKYCVILRQELTKPSGIVNSFMRGCEDRPLYLNNVVEDPTYKTFYRSCTSDLCNTGDGIRSSGSSLDPDAGAGANMIIPGRSNSSKLTSKEKFFYVISSIALIRVSELLQ